MSTFDSPFLFRVPLFVAVLQWHIGSRVLIGSQYCFHLCVCALSVIPQPFAELRGLRQASVGLQGAGFGLEDKLAAGLGLRFKLV